MATCRQAYDEGHALFYSSNTFHLPTTETFEWSDRLQPKHKGLIKRISLTIGPNELTASMISRIDSTYRDFVSEKGEHTAIKHSVFSTMRNAWGSKIAYMATWSSLEEVAFFLFKEADISTKLLHRKHTLHYYEHHTLKQPELLKKLEGFSSLWWVNNHYNGPLWWPVTLTVANITASLDKRTWAETVEWLYVRKQGEMAEGLWDHVPGW